MVLAAALGAVALASAGALLASAATARNHSSQSQSSRAQPSQLPFSQSQLPGWVAISPVPHWLSQGFAQALVSNRLVVDLRSADSPARVPELV